MSAQQQPIVALARRILAGALENQPAAPPPHVRDLAARLGELRQAIRSAITVLDFEDTPGGEQA